MVARHKAQRGFTLVELIISITLVSLISVGMLMAMRTSLMTLDKTRTRLDDNRRTAGLAQMVTRQLGGAMPVVGDCSTAGGIAATPVTVFNGTPQSLHFVSSYSMTEGARGYPRYVEYQVVPNPEGTVKLILNERLYSGPAATRPYCFNYVFLPIQLAPDSFVIADRLAVCRISYQERNDQTGFGGKWLEVWNRPDFPTAVHIEMIPADPDPRRIATGGVTVGFHISRLPDVTYEDQ